MGGLLTGGHVHTLAPGIQVLERRHSGHLSMDPTLLGENLRRNRLARTRLRQAQLRRGMLHGTPEAVARHDYAEGHMCSSMGTAATTSPANAAADDSWGLEFAARQVQRRAQLQVRAVEYSVNYSNNIAGSANIDHIG